MNRVIMQNKKGFKTTVRELLERETMDREFARTAFIGKVGIGPADDLYLLVYDRIVLASNPLRTWSDFVAVFVDRWVDISIEVCELEV